MDEFEKEVLELRTKKDNSEQECDIIDFDEGFQVSKMSKKVKEKKKNKPKKEKKDKLTKVIDNIIGDDAIFAYNQDEDLSILEFADKIKKSTKKTKKGIDFDAGVFVDSDGSSRKKKKSSEKEMVEKFKPQNSMLTALLKEADTDGKTYKEIFNKLNRVEVRGVSKTLTEVMSAINTNTSTRLSIIKAISDLNVKGIDLAMKKDNQKSKKNEDAGLDPELTGASFFQNMFSTGRKNVFEEVNKSTGYSPEEVERIYQQDSNGDGQCEENPSLSDTDAELESILGEYNETAQKPYRSSDGDKLIAYEHLSPKLVIEKDMNSSDWNMIAVDKYGMLISDYPIPDTSKLKLTFSGETDTATDNYGRTYGVRYTLEE